jgi:diguanylate cyclase (GGDEF)-like protein
LCNETTFMVRGYQLLSYAIRHDSSLAIFRIEIDGFGDLYREHGSAMTDSVAQAMGKVLAAVIRQEDTAARIGPARFALLLPGMNTSRVRQLAERISHEFSTLTFNAGDKRTQATVSIGVHSPDIHRNTRFEELLSVADQRLAQAASRGGNRVVDDAGSAAPTPETGVIAAITAAGPVSTARPGNDKTTAPTLEMLLSGDAALEIEEIELTATGFSLPQPRIRDKAPEAGSPATPAPEPPAVFSVEPGPGDAADIAPAGTVSVEAPAGVESLGEMPADLPGTSAEVINGETHASMMTGRIEDTIDISAPFSAHTATIRGADTTGATESAPDNSDAPAARSGSDDADGDGTPPQRSGFFRRTLGLFGRSRSRE